MSVYCVVQDGGLNIYMYIYNLFELVSYLVCWFVGWCVGLFCSLLFVCLIGWFVVGW